MKQLIVLADWASDPLARHEFQTAIVGYIEHDQFPTIIFLPTRLNSFETGFLLSQMVYTQERLGRPQETVYYVGSDLASFYAAKGLVQDHDLPEQPSISQDAVVRLASGIHLVTPTIGYTLTFLSDKIHHLFQYQEERSSVRFAPRDAHARVCAHLMQAQEDEMEFDELHQSAIPRVYDHYVAHTDAQGNIITNLTTADMKGKYQPDDSVLMRLNHVTHRVRFRDSLHEGSTDELQLVPSMAGPDDQPFLMIASASEYPADDVFHKPEPGKKIELSR